MRRGTTPTHTFQLPVNAAELKEIKIIYAQNGKEVLSKFKKDCVLDGETIMVKLTQEETLMFATSSPCQIQVRILSQGDEASASDITEDKVYPILDGGVLTCD